MATPVGTNVVTSIARRYLHDQIVDNVYKSNVIFFRLNAANKKLLQGGYQIEVPELYADFSVGGWYQGYDQLDTTPQDTAKNAAWDWRQLGVPVTIDNLSLARSDSPEAIANLLTVLFAQAQMRAADLLGTGVFSDGVTNTKSVDGFKGAIDDGTVLATYAGLARSSNTWWKSQIDSATNTLTALAIRSLMANCTEGGRHPTIIATTSFIYNRFWNLNQPNQAFPVQPQGSDVQLAQAGFTNLLFDGVPMLVDSHTQTQHMYLINEPYLLLFVKTGLDFFLEDFVKPPNQDVFTAWLKWMGNLVLMNPQRCGKFTALTG